MLYKWFFNLVFKRFDPETAHHLGVLAIKFLSFTGLSKLFGKASRARTVKTMGLRFEGVFGMAAGFDKNAEIVAELGDLGFTHVEVGTVTKLAQSGNDKPRLFRLVSDQALINRMGFNNLGSDAIAKRLSKLRSSRKLLPIIGVNIGKSKLTPIEQAASDYGYSAKVLSPYADYLAVNVSSPNTPGLRSLQAIDQLEPILTTVQQNSSSRPILVKIAPDLADDAIVAVCQLVKRLGLAGIIATNTTISREGLLTDKATVAAIGDGGLSGPVLATRSLEVLRLVREQLKDSFCVISVGGVVSASDVAERLKAGANLVQGYTGFIYQGPLWAHKINRSF